MQKSADSVLQGLEVYRVGGAVRDHLLGWPVYDNDWVIVGATPEAMRARGFQPVGRDFPVFLHPHTHEEYALARTERKSGHGYAGFEVHASPEVTLEEDLERRDLTLNAIAEAYDGRLIDPYGGEADLRARLLRHVSPAFSEDPLRVLRTARFLARYSGLGFRIAEATLALMEEVSRSGELEHLAAERVWVETEKALGEPHPDAYFQALAQCQALSVWFAELAERLEAALFAMAQVPCDTQDVPMAHWRYARLVSVLDDAGREALATRLRLPNAVAKLARQSALTTRLLDGLPSAERVGAWLDGLDAWRRPEQVERQLALVDCLAREWVAPMQQAWQAAQRVSPQDLIAQGFKGAALGQALRDARRDTIEQALANTAP